MIASMIVSGVSGAIGTTVGIGFWVWVVSLMAGTSPAWGTILPILAGVGFGLGALSALLASLFS